MDPFSVGINDKGEKWNTHKYRYYGMNIFRRSHVEPLELVDYPINQLAEIKQLFS